ncbi:MAG: Rieske 2Fe-2S domain-containing protein [Planctomycetota bacterium]
MADLRDSFDTGLRPSDIDPGRPRPIDTPWGSFTIFSCAGRMFATQSFCPHLLGPLFQGTISGETVTCPWHQWRFSLPTGRRLDEAGLEMPGGERLLRRRVVEGPRGTILLVVDPRDDTARP